MNAFQSQSLELFDFEMHPEDKNQAWISDAYCAVENLGEVKNVRSMSIAPETAISMIKGTSGRRESISAALLAGKMKPLSFNKNAIIEEEEEEEENENEKQQFSRKGSNTSVGIFFILFLIDFHCINVLGTKFASASQYTKYRGVKNYQKRKNSRCKVSQKS